MGNILSLEEQMRQVVGKEHLYNISSFIPLASLKPANRGIEKMFPSVVPYLEGETSWQAVLRLLGRGYTFGDLSELAQVALRHPEEIKKYKAVFSLHEGSCWEDENTRWKNRFDGRKDVEPFTFVPYLGTEDDVRWFGRFRFDRPLSKEDGILVFDEKVDRW
jgi:hypothetical protein